jgi:hypothetical protein
MKAKIRFGHELLFTEGASNLWDDIQDDMIINLADKYTYKQFKQRNNKLFIDTTGGLVSIVFTSEVPKLEFDHYCKDQLVLKVIQHT